MGVLLVMTTVYDASNTFIGLALMAVTAYSAMNTMLTKAAPNTVLVTGSGTLGAVVTLVLFALGGVMAAHGLSGLRASGSRTR